MWNLIHSYVGLGAVKVVANIVVDAWPAFTFMIGWKVEDVRYYCQKKEFVFEEQKEVAKKVKPKVIKEVVKDDEPVKDSNTNGRRYQRSRKIA